MSNPDAQPQAGSDQPTIIADLSRDPPGSDPTAATIPMISPVTTRPTVSASAQATVVAPPSKEDLAGQVWGDFTFAGLLGRGGMGAVYRGSQVSLNRPVAIKVLPAHLSADEGFRARFELEAKAVAQINSPHVIQVFGAGIHQGQHFFAMEYVEGSDLSHRLKSGDKIAPRQALDWMIQAARGLAAAGEHGIVHRDVKPGNMMVTKKGVLKLMDFGLVKLASEGHNLTQTGTIMGTVTYFSPEQGRGESCDCRTDIYALGVVFYELITGRLPFTGQDPTSIIYQHIHVQPTPPKAFVPDTPEDWQAVVLKCMQKDAAARYATAADLVADLERLGRNQIPAIPPRELAALRKGLPADSTVSHGKRTLWFGLGGAGVVAASIAAWLALGATAKPLEPLPTPDPRAAPVPPPATGVSASAPAPAPAPNLSPSAASTTAAVAAVVGVDVAGRLRGLVGEGRWSEARALATEESLKAPGEPTWGKALAEIDHGEAAEFAARGRRALADGDLALAERLATQTSTIRPEAGRDLTAAVAEARAARERRVEAIGQAETHLAAGRLAEAEAIFATLANADPTDTQVATLLSRARAGRQTQEQAQAEAQEHLAAGDAALTRHDHDAARAAYSAALANAGTANAARSGLDRTEAGAVLVAQRRQQLTTQLAARDFTAATTTVEEMRKVASATITARAEADLATARLREDERRRAIETQEAAHGGKAKALMAQIDDPASTIPMLEAGLAAFLSEAGADRPERPLLERRIEDRRQAAVAAAGLADLDRGILTGDRAAIARQVADADFAAALARLSSYRGLAFASRLAGFSREGDKATATVSVRHALAVYPERELRYLYEMTRDASGWRISAAHLQP